jgi:hypothetical protein
MPEKTNGLIQTIEALWGGAATVLLAAAIGRLMWHSGEVRQGRRKFIGPELFWELPVAVGMAIIGEGLSGYLGPRGAEVLIAKLLKARPGS